MIKIENVVREPNVVELKPWKSIHDTIKEPMVTGLGPMETDSALAMGFARITEPDILGYPPHKHDQHREDEEGHILEADLEEIYFYKMDRPGGYAFRRIYTEDRRIDTVVMPQHNDVVLIPEGHHPTVSAPGYTTYLLNFLAGSAQSLANSDDPAYTWVKDEWGALDPRLPIVDHGMESGLAIESEGTDL